MYAFTGTNVQEPFNASHWVQIPFRVRSKANDVEYEFNTDGGGNANTGDILFNGNTIYTNNTSADITIQSESGVNSLSTNYAQLNYSSINEANSNTGKSNYIWVDELGTTIQNFADSDNGDYNLSWTFSTDGRLHLPGGEPTIYSSNNADITLSTPGTITLNNTGGTWDFNSNGDLILPAEGDIKDSNGNSVLGGGGSGNRLVSGDNEFVLNGPNIQMPEDGAIWFNYGYIDQDPDTDGNALRISGGVGVSIYTDEDGKRWIFDNSGETTFPGLLHLNYNNSEVGFIDTTADGISIGGALNKVVAIQTDNDEDNELGQSTWLFRADGRIEFPDGTIQETAYQGQEISASVPRSDTAPSASNGQLWFNTEEGRMYVKYNDQWVDASPTVLAPPETNPTLESITFNDGTIQTTAFNGVATSDRLINGDFEVVLGSNGILTAPDDIVVGATGGRFVQDCSDGTTSIRWINVEQGVDNTQMIRAFTGDNDIERAQVKLNWLDDDRSGLSIKTFDNSPQSSDYTWDFQGDGTLKLPSNLSITPLGNYAPANGTAIFQAVGDYLMISSTGTGAATQIGWSENSFAAGATAFVAFNDSDSGSVKITTGDYNSTVNNWTFDSTGILTLPQSNYLETTDTNLKVGSQGTVTIRSNAASNLTDHEWVFGTDGKLTFPQSGSINFLTGSTLAPPSVNGTRSIGAKIVLWPEMSVSGHTDYAIGMDSYTQWFSIPSTDDGNGNNMYFKWYAGNDAIMLLRGDGHLSVRNIIQTYGDNNLTLRTVRSQGGPGGYAEFDLILSAENGKLTLPGSLQLPEGGSILTSAGANILAGYATETYVGTAVSNLVNSAPSTLNTLKELADALGSDASFSTTISTALGNRLRIDINNQSLTSTEKSNARTNLGLATVASSGSYTDLSNKPTIPTSTSDLTNGANFITGSSPAITTPTVTGATVMKTGSTSVADEYVVYLNATATTANQVLDSIATTSYTSVKYIIEAINSTGTELVEVSVTYSGTSPYINATTLISTVTPFQATYDADVTGGNLRLLVTPTNANTKFKVRASAFKVI
jgi:hypothetical protein